VIFILWTYAEDLNFMFNNQAYNKKFKPEYGYYNPSLPK